MRQLFSIRLVAALGALLGLTLLLQAVVLDDEPIVGSVGELEVDATGVTGATEEVVPRRVDLVRAVQQVRRSPDFEITEEGTTVGFLDAEFADGSVMRVAPGTPGEITCTAIRLADRCVVLADLVGEAVLWFALLPRGPNNTVMLPPIVDLEDGYAVFENGWEVRYPPVIERDEATCGDDITSFSDFLRRFGPSSVTVVDLETQEVDSVRCGPEVRPDRPVELRDEPFQPVG